MKLSVLDLSPIPSGQSARDALQHTVDLARRVEALGYERYWLAEHHNAASLACPCPEIVVARLGAVTSRIRVGAGGMMLPNHSALKLAETYRLLEAMYPGRIDLGLGRAPGTDPRTALELRRGNRVTLEDVDKQIDDLLSFLSPDDVPRSPFTTSTVAIPTNVDAPDVFMLSSSGAGAEIAAERGLGLAFAHHMNPADAVSVVRKYRETFKPSPWLAEPYAIISCIVICADSSAEATDLSSTGRLAMLRLAQGKRDLPLPSVQEALDYNYGPDDLAILRMYEKGPIVGDPDVVGTRLSALASDAQADELMLLTMVHDPTARARSYELAHQTLAA